MLELKKFEDENLEVYLIEAEVVRDAEDEDQTIRDEIGDDSEDNSLEDGGPPDEAECKDSDDEDFKNKAACLPYFHTINNEAPDSEKYDMSPPNNGFSHKKYIVDEDFKEEEMLRNEDNFDPYEPFIRCFKLKNTFKK